jgi:hypothetical protein
MSWTKIQGEELQCLQERFEMPSQSTNVEVSTLRTPFYQHDELVKLTDGQNIVFMVAAGQGKLFQRKYYSLTGTSTDICAANEAAGLVITRDNAIDYVRFFDVTEEREWRAQAHAMERRTNTVDAYEWKWHPTASRHSKNRFNRRMLVEIPVERTVPISWFNTKSAGKRLGADLHSNVHFSSSFQQIERL